MATVTFNSSMPSGLRLESLFTWVVDGAISLGTSPGVETASFQVLVYQSPVDVFYAGPDISGAAGAVSYLRVGPENQPWLTYGDVSGPVQFHYKNLADFHASGATAAAAIMAGDDHLIGTGQGDHLEGYGGNDLLDGGAGADTLDGGSGNDTYVVDDRNDRVIELAGGGYDVVQTSASFTMASDAEIEELRAASWASGLSLIGSDFSNLIVGTAGDDEIDGKGGIDTLIGGAGNDVYSVDSAFDVIVEKPGEGHDVVVAYASYQLGDNLEALKASPGYSSLVLIGNALSNEIVGNLGANVISGLDGNDGLYGDGGNDSLYGGDGDDALYGGIGNDFLDGGQGNDSLYGDVGDDVLVGGADQDGLYGGSGNDSLYGEDGNDSLYGDVGNDVLDGGAGDDLLFGGTGNNKLYGESGQDNLYGGMNVDSLYGGDGNDRLYGDAGNDFLDGGPGQDTLSGGWGRDTFIFRDALNARTNVDTITDFNVRDDTIWLENKIFKKLGKAGPLKPDFFTVGSHAQDRNDHLIYNKKTGYLYYDADGSGHAHAILFAKLKAGLAIGHDDFRII